MENVFKSLMKIFTDLTSDIVNGLNYALGQAGINDLKSFTIDLRILSDNAIVSFSLYDFVYYFVLTVLLVFIYKLIKRVLLMPFKLLRGIL